MAERNSRCAVVLVVDALGAGYLGPYGNTWIDTPNFNRLAAQSLLVEHAIIDSPQREPIYRSYWQGLHAMCSEAVAGCPALGERLAAQGATSLLLSDADDIFAHPLASSFAQHQAVALEEPPQAAASVEQTQLARLTLAAVDCLSQWQPPGLLWIHSRGMSAPWDAPLSLRRSLADDEDPDPPESVEVPALHLAEDYDPDRLLGLVQSYGGQIMLLDLCLGVLHDALQAAEYRDDCLLIVTSPRGFPLGEHLRVGYADEALHGPLLHGPLLHVPLLAWQSSGAGAAMRSQQLAQPADLYATLLAWFGCLEADAPPSSLDLLALAEPQPQWPRDRAGVLSSGEKGLRTPAWYLRQAENSHLFRKPDDRVEVNEISDRCPDVADQMRQALADFEKAAMSGNLANLKPLPEVLIHGID